MDFVLVVISAVIFYIILYGVIKAAVRDGIIEARQINSTSDDDAVDDGTHISQTICPNCGKKHDIDYPKCPHCKHQYY